MEVSRRARTGSKVTLQLARAASQLQPGSMVFQAKEKTESLFSIQVEKALAVQSQIQV